jgi:hypothetical protein
MSRANVEVVKGFMSRFEAGIARSGVNTSIPTGSGTRPRVSCQRRASTTATRESWLRGARACPNQARSTPRSARWGENPRRVVRK